MANTTPLEKEVQNSICEYLTIKKFYFWRQNTVPVFSRNNGGKMAFRSKGKYAKNGIPDILMIVRGRFVGIEVKREGVNKLRPEQEDFERGAIDNGGIYFIVHSVKELEERLQDYLLN